jgi:uncharacterized protein with ParB-like and HNH nuclease domain
MDAGKRSLSDIIKPTRLLVVPFYQRGYVWRKEEWQRLLEDAELISQTDHRYFVGSIILKQQLTDSSSRYERRTIIDGQQRLTTLSIFFKVLSLKIGEPSRFDNRFRLEADDAGQKNLAIKHSYRDKVAFDRVLAAETPEEIEGDERIIQCFNYYVRHLDPDSINFDRVYNNLLFVGIDLGVDEDEQQIFDTINSLGIRLTTSELLKNHFFKENNVDEYEKYWKNTFEADKGMVKYWEQEVVTSRSRRSLIDMFFYSFLQLKVNNKSLNIESKDKLLYEKVDRLFESYKHYLSKYEADNGLVGFLEEMREYANLFRQIVHPDATNHPVEHMNPISRINNVMFGLDSTILMTYVLYVAKKNGLGSFELNEILATVEAFILRRYVVKASTREYSGLFSGSLILNEISTKEKFMAFMNSKVDKSVFMPTDEQLKFGFDNSRLTNARAKGLLYMLESSVRDYDRHGSSLLSMKKYSLEHLMPKKWENNWDMPSTQIGIDERNNKLLTLGNLTIITQSLNANINDADWHTKLTGRGSHKGLKAYSAGIETLAEYLELPAWNEATIEQRANDLYEMAKNAWHVSKA